MNAIAEAIARLLRGPRVSRMLQAVGIDPQRYWLLMDLFDQLSERGEMLDELGRNGVALKVVAWFYFAMSGLIALLLVTMRTSVAAYFSTCMVFSGFALLSILLPETGNSLMNPVEGLVLAHQPINGATYTAAKLTHLGRILLYMVPGLSAVPAFAGLLLDGSHWSYPFFHLVAAAAGGAVEALLCCALFGWLIRFVPVSRLKAAGQLAAMLPFVGMTQLSAIGHLLARAHLRRWLPVQAPARWSLAVGTAGIAVAIVVLGIRSLSADYLIRVSSMVRGGPATRAKERHSRMAAIVARFCGGQPSRAGFVFVSRLMLRDWQFRRQILPVMILPIMALAGICASGVRVDPFSGRFTPVHVLPHIFGTVLFFTCFSLPYGSDYKGAWIFLLVPARAFAGFARGVYALLWVEIVVIPHVTLLLPLAWLWGISHAGLFVAYSLAAASLYLALELRLIEGPPFCSRLDPARGAVALPMMIGGGIVMAIAVGLQFFLVFRSPAIVIATTAVVGIAAWFLTRSSLDAFEVSIRYRLSLLSADSGTLYQEVAV